jgi:hypothetical protein
MADLGALVAREFTRPWPRGLSPPLVLYADPSVWLSGPLAQNVAFLVARLSLRHLDPQYPCGPQRICTSRRRAAPRAPEITSSGFCRPMNPERIWRSGKPTGCLNRRADNYPVLFASRFRDFQKGFTAHPFFALICYFSFGEAQGNPLGPRRRDTPPLRIPRR